MSSGTGWYCWIKLKFVILNAVVPGPQPTGVSVGMFWTSASELQEFLNRVSAGSCFCGVKSPPHRIHPLKKKTFLRDPSEESRRSDSVWEDAARHAAPPEPVALACSRNKKQCDSE